MITTAKYSYWMVPKCAPQIRDGGRPSSWKNRKIAISPQPFDQFWRNLARWCIFGLCTWSIIKISRISKSNMADGRHLEKLENCDISLLVWPILTKFGIVMHLGPTRLLGHYIVTILKIQDGEQPSFWKSNNDHISTAIRLILIIYEIWHDDASDTTTANQPLKFPTFEKAKLFGCHSNVPSKIGK